MFCILWSINNLHENILSLRLAENKNIQYGRQAWKNYIVDCNRTRKNEKQQINCHFEEDLARTRGDKHCLNDSKLKYLKVSSSYSGVLQSPIFKVFSI